ncbi:MAG: hypothetical protein HYV41_02910 [Candidatus Magasanikbacteria bacterium]|nr:hypothetical protein [Candidatus Magasanikbacteria bacterium]
MKKIGIPLLLTCVIGLMIYQIFLTIETQRIRGMYIRSACPNPEKEAKELKKEFWWTPVLWRDNPSQNDEETVNLFLSFFKGHIFESIIAPYMGFGDKEALYPPVDITGDAVLEFFLPRAPGASTAFMYLIRVEEDGTPIVSRAKESDGTIYAKLFSSGGGGAGRYGSNTIIFPDQHAIGYMNYRLYGGEDDYCNADVYRWNQENSLFEFDKNLSDSFYQETFCNESFYLRAQQTSCQKCDLLITDDSV